MKGFRSEIRLRATRSHSRLILALDLDHTSDPKGILQKAKTIVKETSAFICAVKVNFHLLLPLNIEEMKSLITLCKDYGLPAIADIKLNDIANTNRVATEYLWAEGFSAVIVNPFVGYKGGLDIVLDRAKELGRGVISLAYMSHEGGDEGYGLTLRDGRTIFELFVDRARKWNVDGIIVGSTRPEIISSARSRSEGAFFLFSPGSGAQGGDPLKSLEAGSDFIIVGRSIVQSKTPGLEARQLFDNLAAWTDTHPLPSI